MTQLAGADALTALDPVFARFAVSAGQNLWRLPHLTMREKAFVCLTSDLCHPHLDQPLAMHLQMALANGVDPESIRELYRHLAPYVGYPILVSAFQRLAELGLPEAKDTEPGERMSLSGPLAKAIGDLAAVAPGLAAFSAQQLIQRWARPHLSVRERAIACLTVDVFYQTLDTSLRLHADVARTAGADDETLHDLVRGLAEFGLGRAWAAAAVLFPAGASD